MKNAFILLSICMLMTAAAEAEMDCQKAYPIPATTTDKIAETEAAADIFKGCFRVPPMTIQAKMKASLAQHDVLAKYPNANVVALRQQELFYVCQLLNGDKSIGTKDKASILQNVVEGSQITKTMVQKAQASAAKNESSQGGGTSTTVSGNNNTVINGNGNQVEISYPPTNPYTAQTTYRVNGTRSEIDSSAGSYNFDSTVGAKYYGSIQGAELRGEFDEMLRLSNMAIQEAPAWFEPYYEKGRALIHLCHLKEADEQLKAFINATQGATQYRGLAESARINIQNPDTVWQGHSKCQ